MDNIMHQEIMNKAEKLLQRGSYLLAKEQFEKAGQHQPDEGVAQKIQLCESNYLQLKAKDMVKRGRKQLKKRLLAEALKSFAEAYRISGEDWIRERIKSLETELANHNILAAAKKAELEGNHAAAAGFYDQAFANLKNEGLLFKKARVLIKNRNYDEAIVLLEKLNSSEDGALYDHGFALAQTHKYYECLKVWDRIKSKDAAWERQRISVQYLLAMELERQAISLLPHSADLKFTSGELGDIFRKGLYLLTKLAQPDINARLRSIIEACKYNLIVGLWQEEKYAEIKKIMLPLPPVIDSDLLLLYAKLFFKLYETTGEFFQEFAMFWLTAVYNVYAESAEVRQALIRQVEPLIEKSKKHALWWELEKQAIAGIYSLAAPAGSGIEKDGTCAPLAPAAGHKLYTGQFEHLVCTPQFAGRFGKSAKILDFIQANKQAFNHEEDYLAMGGYYSLAGTCLYLIRAGECEKARKHLSEFSGGAIYGLASDEKEFIEYCAARTDFTYTLSCLKNGTNDFSANLSSAMILFNLSDRYENELITNALAAREVESLQRYETVLKTICARQSSKELKTALSWIMSLRVKMLFAAAQINLKVAEAVIKNALKLNPGNELARKGLEHIEMELELETLDKALANDKMSKACQIAAAAKSPEAKKMFFSYIENTLEAMENDKNCDDHTDLLIANKLLNFGRRVDAAHPVLSEIIYRINKKKSGRIS